MTINDEHTPSSSSRRSKRNWLLLALSAIVLIAASVLVTTFILRHEESHSSLLKSQLASIDAAILSLGKINAATEVGVNFRSYGQLLIDAKAATNLAVRLAPTNNMTQMAQLTMQRYADAAEVWQRKIRYPELKLAEVYGDGEIIEKYNLKPLKFSGEDGKIDPDIAMQKIWSIASGNYQRLLALREVRTSN